MNVHFGGIAKWSHSLFKECLSYTPPTNIKVAYPFGSMKLRMVALGVLELAISVILYISRGFHPVYLGLLSIGVALIILGLFWR